MDLIRIFGERSIVQRNWIRFKNQTNNNEFSKRERKHMFPLFWQKQKKIYRILVRIKTHTQIWSFFFSRFSLFLAFVCRFTRTPIHINMHIHKTFFLVLVPDFSAFVVLNKLFQLWIHLCIVAISLIRMARARDRTIFRIFYCLLYKQNAVDQHSLTYSLHVSFARPHLMYAFLSHSHQKIQKCARNRDKKRQQKSRRRVTASLSFFRQHKQNRKQQQHKTANIHKKYSGKSENYEQPKPRWNHLKILLHNFFFSRFFLLRRFFLRCWYRLFFCWFGFLSVAQSHHFISFYSFIHSFIYLTLCNFGLFDYEFSIKIYADWVFAVFMLRWAKFEYICEYIF